MCLWGLGLETLPSADRRHGGQVPLGRRQGDPGGPLQHLLLPRAEQDDRVRGPALGHEHRRRASGVGNIFYGSEGYLVVKGYNTYESFDRRGKPGPEEQGRRPGRQALRQLHRGGPAAAIRRSCTDRSRPRTPARRWPTWATSPTGSAAGSSSTRPPRPSSATARPTPC